ncbi:hypothetical protein O9992_01515 [Vibrio lentus]|nr:hypothetical protein [Vibrio lentus]
MLTADNGNSYRAAVHLTTSETAPTGKTTLTLFRHNTQSSW